MWWLGLRGDARIFGLVAPLVKSTSRLRFRAGKTGDAISSISKIAAELIDDKEDSSSEMVSDLEAAAS